MTESNASTSPKFYGIQSDLINVSSYGKEKYTFNPERGDITFYCHDCNKSVEVDRPTKKIYFTCKQCKGHRIAIGTQEGVKERYGKR